MSFDIKKLAKKIGKEALKAAPYFLAGAGLVASVTPTPADDLAVELLDSVMGDAKSSEVRVLDELECGL
jgi:hypothetical protein